MNDGSTSPTGRRGFHTLALSCLAFLGAALLPTGCDSKQQDPNVVRIGCDLTYPPFEMLDDSGQPSGAGVDLALALAAHLGKHAEIVPISFDSLIDKLEEGEIDIILSSMTINEVRSQKISFSDPYAKTGLATLVPIDSPLTGPEDLRKPGLRIAVRTGTTSPPFCRKNYPEAVIIEKAEDFECVLAVTANEADAYIFDQLAIWRHHQSNSRTTRAILDLLTEEQWGIGVRQEDGDLRAEINAFLAEFRSSGGLARLEEKYLASESRVLRELGQHTILE